MAVFLQIIDCQFQQGTESPSQRSRWGWGEDPGSRRGDGLKGRGGGVGGGGGGRRGGGCGGGTPPPPLYFQKFHRLNPRSIEKRHEKAARSRKSRWRARQVISSPSSRDFSKHMTPGFSIAFSGLSHNSREDLLTLLPSDPVDFPHVKGLISHFDRISLRLYYCPLYIFCQEGREISVPS